MHITRRMLLKGGVATVVATSVPLRWVNPLVGLPALGAPTALLWLTRATYVPLVNSSFSVRPPGGSSSPFKLVAIRDIATPGGGLLGQGCFSLLFDGGAARLPQGSYPISHLLLGSSQLFIVPVGTAAGGRQSYELVVNRP